jgi:hypothetical protein
VCDLDSSELDRGAQVVILWWRPPHNTLRSWLARGMNRQKYNLQASCFNGLVSKPHRERNKLDNGRQVKLKSNQHTSRQSKQRQSCSLAWVSQPPPVHYPKNPVLGLHGWDETVPQGSVYLVSRFFFLLLLFFPSSVFFFFSWQQFYYPIFLAHPWPQVFFWAAHTYPPNLNPKPQPTYPLLPTNPPTSLILLAPSPPTPFCAHFHC